MGQNTSSHKISAQDRAILDMKNQRDKLHQYQKRITTITSRETAIARECLSRGDKPKALLALRRKKFQESLLARSDREIETLEQLTRDVEFASVQKDVLYGLQQGTSVLKQIHAEIGGIDHVEKLMENNAEARAYQEEVSEMLRGQMTNQDEDEVEDELEAMEGEIDGVKEPTEEPDTVRYPPAPTNEPVFAGELKQSAQQKARRRARLQERAAAQTAEPLPA